MNISEYENAIATFRQVLVDLAKATGQATDPDAELAGSLMDVAVAHMAHAPRGKEPAPRRARRCR